MNEYLFVILVQQSQYIRMDSQSTTKSVTIDHQVHHFNLEAKHLINTTKVLRGHKLKTQDFIRLQLMRFRYCSPVKYEDQIEQNLQDLGKTTEFKEKYRGFQFEEDDRDLYKFITYQREKKSREVTKRIKMFNPPNHQHLIKPEKMPFYNTQFSIKVKPATSHQHRANTTWKKLNKTISFNRTDTISASNKIQFTSQNLGEKMNDYMNQMIDPKIQLQNADQQIDNRKTTIEYRNIEANRLNRTATRQKRVVPQNIYLKQLKKRVKSKYEATLQASKQFKSQQQPIFYSMQLKNQMKDHSELKSHHLQSKLSVMHEKIPPYNSKIISAKISK